MNISVFYADISGLIELMVTMDQCHSDALNVKDLVGMEKEGILLLLERQDYEHESAYVGCS